MFCVTFRGSVIGSRALRGGGLGIEGFRISGFFWGVLGF